MKTRILVGAIAKNEAAYLPQWIFHYLNLGVSEIKILINGTTDDSVEILDRIAAKYPVRYRIADDLTESLLPEYSRVCRKLYAERNPLQANGYAELLQYGRSHEFSHLLLVDIDELIYLEGHQSLSGIVHEYPDTVLEFQWFNHVADKTSFSNGFSEVTFGIERPNVKSLIPIDPKSKVVIKSSHQVITELNTVQVDFEIGYIFHRWLRSEPEYLRLLSRGDTFNNSVQGLKLNRPGWISRWNTKKTFSSSWLSDYSTALDNFISECGVSDLLAQARNKIVSQLGKQDAMFQKINEEIDSYLRTTRGTRHCPNVSGALSEEKARLIAQSAIALCESHPELASLLAETFLINSYDGGIVDVGRSVKKGKPRK